MIKKKEEKPIPGIRLLPDEGVIKEILIEGIGNELPKTNQEVAVIYKGVWTNGEAIDKIISVKAPYRFTVGVQQVMAGWDIAIPTMKRGEKSKVTIDPKYGSGWPSCPAYFPYDAKAQYEIDILDFYSKRGTLDTWDPLNLQKLADEYKAQGKEYFTMNRIDHALYSYNEALKFCEAIEVPNSDQVCLKNSIKLNVAVCEFKLNNFKEVISLTNDLIKTDPNIVKSYYLRGMSNLKLEKFDLAYTDLQKVLEKNPEDTKTRQEFEKITKILNKDTGAKNIKKSHYSELFNTHDKLYEDKKAKQKPLPPYNHKNPRIFIDFHIGKSDPKRIICELFMDKAPKTVENFRAICTGEKMSSISPRLNYSGCKVIGIDENFGVFTGDLDQKIDEKAIKGPNSIYGEYFEDENFSIPHRAGVISMLNSGSNTNGSKFIISFKDSPELDGHQIAFGRIVQGMADFMELRKLSAKDSIFLHENIWIDTGAYPDFIKNPENC